jgi:hypothetical protein
MDPRTPERDFIRFAGIYRFGRGTLMGAKRAIVVPSYLHAEREGHAPVVAVLVQSGKKQQERDRLLSLDH